MNSYLEAVQAHLTDLPQEESSDLIAYYQEYFIESGLTLEDITAQYGTPKQFATKLKLSYFLDQDDHAHVLEHRQQRSRLAQGIPRQRPERYRSVRELHPVFLRRNAPDIQLRYRRRSAPGESR